MCIMTEYHMRSDNMSAENRLLIAALKMSRHLSCAATRPGAYDSTISMKYKQLYHILDYGQT